MHVVAHQAVRVHVPAIRLDDSSQDDEQNLAVGVVMEDVLAAIAAWEGMVCGAGLVPARLPWHERRSRGATRVHPCPPEKGVSPLEPGDTLRAVTEQGASTYERVGGNG